MSKRNVVVVTLAVSSVALPARAQTAPAPDSGPPGAPPPPAPYSAPFGMRSVSAASFVRAETTYGLNAGTSSTVVQYLTASYAPISRVSVFARAGWVDFIPNAGAADQAFTNVAIGAHWADNITRDLRYVVSVGTGLPVGQGGGDLPNAGEAAAISAGNLARSRMEGSTMFSPDDFSPFVGADIAWVRGGLTVQADASIFEVIRVRGGGVDPATGEPFDPDATKTSLPFGLHAAYFLIPNLAISVEVREQVFLTTPASVADGKSSRTWATAGGGFRAHLPLGRRLWLRPGLAFFQPLNDPSPTISASNYHIVQLDVPLVF